MLQPQRYWALPLVFLLACAGTAQQIRVGMPPGFPGSGGPGDLTIAGPGDRFAPMDAIQTTSMDFNLFLVGSRNPHTTDVQSPGTSVSQLDLKSPGKARREYEHGYRLLMGKDLQGAAEHLTKAITIYPKFVAAHNALGTAYLDLGQNEQARGEFAQAVALDDHLPNSYLNLGCAELALKQYPEAEETLRKASAIAPLDVQLQLALAYGEFLNKDYPSVLSTSRQVHGQKHDGAAVVHLFAAAAWQAQGNLDQAQDEMQTLLREEPQSASAGQFRQILEQMKAQQARVAEAKLHPAQNTTAVAKVAAEPTPEEVARHRQIALQQDKEESQIAEAEAAPDSSCADCGATFPAPASGSGLQPASTSRQGATFRVSVDEVSVFFAAMDHGKSVTDLAVSDIGIRDDSQPPNAILAFRNESQLPLRLGLVVDTSDSVAERFSFEQAAATRFLQDVVAGKDDLAFVVGVSNSVFLVQDFTADPALTSHAISQLAPGGGTALWDAVAFAAEKLAGHPEAQPVARMLVVISDGQDNSSSMTLKQAIANAQRGEVAVYTVSSRDALLEERSALLGDHALRTLSELTGGTAFMPGSVRSLSRSLVDLQQVIRSRYLVSYKPASFRRDDRYRAIDIEANKDGRKLTVFARKGYYASAAAQNLPGH